MFDTLNLKKINRVDAFVQRGIEKGGGNRQHVV